MGLTRFQNTFHRLGFQSRSSVSGGGALSITDTHPQSSNIELRNQEHEAKALCKVICLDLGTANSVASIPGLNRYEAPTYVAVETNRIVKKGWMQRSQDPFNFRVGSDVRRGFEKDNALVQTVRPIKNGVVDDIELASKLIIQLNGGLKEANSHTRLVYDRILFGLPKIEGQSDTARTARVDSTRHAIQLAFGRNFRGKYRPSYFVEEALAAAVYAVPLFDTSEGGGIIDFGGGTVDIAIVCQRSYVKDGHKSIEGCGGDDMNQAIVDHIQNKYDFEISLEEAERLKCEIGVAVRPEAEGENESRVVNGKDSKGFRAVAITSMDIFEAIDPILTKITLNIIKKMQQIPRSMANTIQSFGARLTGGGAKLKRLGERITNDTQITTKVADDPEHAVIKGLELIAMNEKLFNSITTNSDNGRF